MPHAETVQQAQTRQRELNDAIPPRVFDQLREIVFGDVLERLSHPSTRSLATTPALAIAASVVTFPRPVLAIIGMTATVGGNNNAVVFAPTGSAVAATASAGAPPAVHTATVQKDAQGRIISVTFSAAPTIPFAEVVEAPAALVENLAETAP